MLKPEAEERTQPGVYPRRLRIANPAATIVVDRSAIETLGTIVADRSAIESLGTSPLGKLNGPRVRCD